MSIRIMTAVWDSRRYDSGTLLVLLAMADYANDEDNTCHPSIARLAVKSRLSDRQVSRILTRLKTDGVIAHVGEKPAPQGRPIVIYRINIETLLKGDTMSPLSAAKGDISAAKGDIDDTLKVTPMSYDPSYDPSVDPSLEEGTAPPSPPAAAQNDDAPWWGKDPEPAPPAAPTPTVKTLTQQPPIAMYRDAFMRYPSRPQMALIMAHGVTDLRRWREVLNLWVGFGWSVTNVAGMLDLYDHPERIAERRAPRQPAAQPRPSQQVGEGWDEFVAAHTNAQFSPEVIAATDAFIASVLAGAD